jgi:hypothetical protein
MNNLISLIICILIFIYIHKYVVDNTAIYKLLSLYIILLIIWFIKKQKEAYSQKKVLSNKILKQLTEYKTYSAEELADFNKLDEGSTAIEDINNLKKVKSKRKKFESPEDSDEIDLKCPNRLKEFSFHQDRFKFCSNNGKFGSTNNTCSLNPLFRKNYPLCKTYPCPKDYKLIKENIGGLCHNDYTNDLCALDPSTAGVHDLCYGRNDYNKIDNYDYHSLTNLKTINNATNATNEICEDLCNKNELCNFFTLDKSNCKLFTKLESNDLKPNYNKSIIFKNPTNYKFEEDVTINQNTISEHSMQSVQHCANLCNNNNNCKSFVWGKKNNIGDCILKNNKSKFNKEYNDQYDTYSKKYNYHDNIGKLCFNPYEQMQQQLKSTFSNLKNDLDNSITVQTEKNKKYLVNLHKKIITDIHSNVINNLIKDDNVFIWNKIIEKCTTVKIELYQTTSKLDISAIYIYGKNILSNNNSFNLMTLPGITLNTSSGNTEDVELCKDLNLKTSFSTDIENYPSLTVEFNHIVLIQTIVIYGNTNNSPNLLYPMKVTLLNDKKFVKHALKNNVNGKLTYNKKLIDPPTDLFTYESRGITDFGDPTNFRGWVDVTKSGKNYDYCRIVKDADNNTSRISCSSTYDTNQYNFNSISNIDLGYSNTQYMKDESGNGRADFCRCMGNPPNTYVSCLEANEKMFGKEFTPQYSMTNCHNYSGEDLSNFRTNLHKNFNKNLLLKKCNTIPEYNNLVNYTISSSFYNYKNKSYYLLRNIFFNKKNVVLISIVNKDSHQIRNGFPKLLNENFWPNLPKLFYTGIDATLFVGNNSIIIFRDLYYIYYNLSRLIPYYIDTKNKKFIYNIKKLKTIKELIPQARINKVLATSTIDTSLKKYNDNYNIFESILIKSIDLNNQNLTYNKLISNFNKIDTSIDVDLSDKCNESNKIKKIRLFNYLKEYIIEQNLPVSNININKIITFYTVRKDLLDSNKITRNETYNKFLEILKQTDITINNLLDKIYPLINKYYIPPCYIFYDNNFIEMSLDTSNNYLIDIKKLNRENFYNYPYSSIDAIVHFYDSKIPNGLIFNKNKFFSYNKNSNQFNSNFINVKYPKLWKINLNNLLMTNKKLYSIKFNKLNLPDYIIEKYNIKIKIYLVIENNKQFIYELNNESANLSSINCDEKIKLPFNTQNNSSIEFELILDDDSDVQLRQSISILLSEFNDDLLLNNSYILNFNLEKNNDIINLPEKDLLNNAFLEIKL